MEKIMIAQAGEKASQPVEFTGVIKSVSKRAAKDTDGGDSEGWLSIAIEGLPPLYGEDGRKLSVLRTRKQAENDLRYFSDPNASLDSLEIDFDIYAVDREVSFLVSAHQAGAELEITAGSYYTTPEGGSMEVGETVIMKKAGYYIEGFFDITFDRADKKERKAELAEAERKATRVSLG